MEQQIARIALSGVPYSADKLYSYLVPPELADACRAGVRVSVPFGRGNRRTEGFVLETLCEAADKPLKPVFTVLDEQPLLDASLLRLAKWMKARYFCTVYDALKTILPAGIWFRYRETYRLADGVQESDLSALAAANRTDKLLLETITARGELERSELEELGGAQTMKRLKLLCEQGVLYSETMAIRQISDKSLRMVSLAVSAEDALAAVEPKRRSAPLRYAAVEMLCAQGTLSSSDICYYTGASLQTLRGLEKAGIVSFAKQEVLRVSRHEPVEMALPIVLNDEQQQAFDGLLPLIARREAGAALLHGVTASGKTQVYIRLIEETLAMGRTAMLLVPEIALTPQMMAKFTAYFGENVAMLHSGLQLTERYDQWKRIRRGDVRVVLGTRSAVFAPFDNLGLIVVDEEHEGSYQSESAPRYHAVEVAQRRAQAAGAPLLLGSATPSLLTYFRACSGRYRLLELPERVMRRPLPAVEVVDMREEFLSGNNGIFSGRLVSLLGECLETGRQAMLFMNRRGYSTFVSCRACGSVVQCPNCDVSMTYHKADQRLRCHFCGASAPVPARCPVCGKPFIKYFGIGTEQVEEQLHALFPGARALRMDTDTMRGRDAHARLLEAFAAGEAQVLIGTQMIAKGHDFPNVTLVGVVAADATLCIPDYRSAERAFQLLTQVSGRAGRDEAPGRVVVQTYQPGHPVIRFARAHDYRGFYQYEMLERRKALLPPYSLFVRILFSGRDEAALEAAGERYGRELERELLALLGEEGAQDLLLLVPSPAPIRKKQGAYRYQVLVKLLRTKRTAAAIRLIYAFAAAHRSELFAQLEVNPQDMF